ncbi:MAG: hypothetical protein BMS9Abin30_1333 [Gammaproteobacteria bacterium]|nr:MAG: hypothetical protein BMS9Abin30_1333 [Gammaproteobacteria bacterium]
MRRYFASVTLLLLSGILNTAAAQNLATVSEWDRSSAMAAVRSVNIDTAVAGISDLKDLEGLENRSDWPLPAREAAVYKFTRSLASLPRDAVATAVLQHLKTYQVQVLVPHEDYDDAIVPLFNIRGAAAGVENGWLRDESAAEAREVLAQRPAALVAKYLESSNHSQRSGYLDALANAEASAVQAVQTEALNQLGESPELTRLVAVTATATGDPFATRRLLVDGRGAGLAPAFESLASRTTPAATAAMLEFALEQAPAGNAALAIAAWWPALRSDAATRQLLIDKLADPALGSSVALALAKSPDIQTIRELQRIAGGDSAAAQRAQLALNINRAGLVGEVRK